MREARAVYFEDLREKAATARSAHNRPRRGGCKLPNYTAKELRELNGPNYSVNLGKPVSLEELRGLPENLRNEYIQNLIDKYGAGPAEIALVLGAHKQTVQYHLHLWGFRFKPGKKRVDLEKLMTDFGLVADAPAKKMTLQNVSFSLSGPFDAEAFVRQLSSFVPSGSKVKVSVVVEF